MSDDFDMGAVAGMAAERAATPAVRALIGMELPVSPRHSTKNLAAVFEQRPIIDPIKTEADGTPRYKDVLFVTITSAHDRFSRIVRPATKEDKQRFARAYRAFEEGNQGTMDGTPLFLLTTTRPALLTRVQVKEIEEGLHLRTIEQLAEAGDDALNKLFPGWGVKARGHAKQFLAMAAERAPQARVESALEEAQLERDLLREELAKVQEQLKTLQKSDAPSVAAPKKG